MTPWPPRPWMGNSASAVRLPNPCSVTLSSSAFSFWPSAIASRLTTASPLRSLIPMTPWVARPVSRASLSGKRIA